MEVTRAYHCTDTEDDNSIHILEPHVIVHIGDLIKDYKQVMFIAKGRLFEPDGTMDHHAFELFDKAHARLEELYAMRTIGLCDL